MIKDGLKKMSEVNWLIVDPSSRKTAIYSTRLDKFWVLTTPAKTDREVTLYNLCFQFPKILREVNPDMVIIEDVSYNSQGNQTLEQGMIGGLLRGCCNLQGFPYFQMNITVWKFLVFLPRIYDEKKKKTIRQRLYKTNAKFRKQYIHRASIVCGKSFKSDDMADAYMIGITAFNSLYKPDKTYNKKNANKLGFEIRSRYDAALLRIEKYPIHIGGEDE